MSIQAKLIMAAILAALILGLGFTAKHYYTVSVEQGIKIKDLEKKNKEIIDSKETLRESNVIDDKSCLEVNKDKTNAEDVRLIIDNKLAEKEKGIKDKHKIINAGTNTSKPSNTNVTNVTDVTMEQEISAARVDSMWETYCSFSTKCPTTEVTK